MGKSRKNISNNSGSTYYRKSFECDCGYKFISQTCRLVSKIKKLHESRCTIAKNAITQYEDIHIDYNKSEIVETSSTILHKI